jgi:hypothetical protein
MRLHRPPDRAAPQRCRWQPLVHRPARRRGRPTWPGCAAPASADGRALEQPHVARAMAACIGAPGRAARRCCCCSTPRHRRPLPAAGRATGWPSSTPRPPTAAAPGRANAPGRSAHGAFLLRKRSVAAARHAAQLNGQGPSMRFPAPAACCCTPPPCPGRTARRPRARAYHFVDWLVGAGQRCGRCCRWAASGRATRRT